MTRSRHRPNRSPADRSLPPYRDVLSFLVGGADCAHLDVALAWLLTARTQQPERARRNRRRTLKTIRSDFLLSRCWCRSWRLAGTRSCTRSSNPITGPEGNDGVPGNFCSAGPAPNLRPRPPGRGTGDHSHARVPGQRTLYDRLSPYLSPPRRVVLFDFLGWGSSDKPSGYPYTADNQLGDLDAVITQLGLGQVVLVAHDASGPPAIDWALAHPQRVAGLVLLNTYYCEMPTLRPPEAIWLFSTPVIRRVARPVSQMFGNWLFRRMYWWQVGGFIRDADVRREFVPLLYQQFDATPSARPAFFRLNEDLLPTVQSRTQMIPKLKEFRRPVRIIFGDADPSLNSGVARTFHQFLPGSELFLIPGAQHFVQLDEPEQVARLILAMPGPGNTPA
jgi:haloalkane dehalogenase